MYSQEVINTLKSSIGWSVNPDLPIVISDNVEIPGSSLKYNHFHELVSLLSLYHTVDESKLTSQDFNKLLSELSSQCVQFSLTAILEKSPLYDDVKNYDNIILTKKSLFQDVMGLYMSIKVFEIYMASNRSNYIERNAKLSYQNLKIELEGVKNEGGFQVAVGIRQQLYKAVKHAQEVIFPFVPSVKYIDFW